MPSSDSDLVSDSGAAEALFHDWRRAAPQDDEAGFAQLCAAHPELEAGLRRMRADHARGLSLIERLASVARESDAPPIALAPADAGPIAPRDNARRYAFEGEVGRGGMGVVLHVRDRELGRSLAMKVARPAAGDGSSTQRRIERLGAEARVQARLDHPGVLPVHELGLGGDGTLYFTMPLVRGRGLDEILAEHRAGAREWTGARVAGVLLRVCEAVNYAHHQGVVHRDLKPSNVMVGEFGETYVTDWGLAQVAGARDERDLRLVEQGSEDSPFMTRDGDVVGTPAYMPPEQAAGDLAQVDARADVYAIGAMLYELLAGERPYGEKPPWQVLAELRAGPPEPLARRAPRVPEELVAVCERAMERDPDRRYAGVAELALDLRAWTEGRVVRAHATGPVAELRKWVGRNRLAAAALATVLFVTVGGLTLYARAASRAADELAASLYRTNVALASAALSSGDTAPLFELLANAPEELRGWEWHYLARLGDASRAVLRGDGKGFHCLAVSPDGRLLAAGDDAGIVRVWDAARAVELVRFRAEGGPLRKLAFTADSRTLGASGDERALRLFDARDGRALGRGASTDRSYATLHFDLDADLAATGRYEGAVELFSARSGVALGALEGVHELGVEQVAFARGGALALTSARDGRVAVWELPARRCLRSWHAHEGWVRALAVSPDGRLVASGGSDGAAAVWSIDSGERIASLPPDSGGVFALAWSPDATRLATAGGPSIRTWETERWRERARLVGHSSRVVGLAFAPDGRTLASIGFDDELRLHELARAEARAPQPAHAGDVEALVFLDGGDRVVSGGRDGAVVVRRFEDGRVLASRQSEDGAIFALAASPDGALVAAAGDTGGVALLGTRSLAPRGRLTHAARVNDLAFLDDDALWIADSEGALTLRRVGDGGAMRRHLLSGFTLVNLALDAGRDRLVVAAADGAVHLCRATTGEPRAAVDVAETGGPALALSADGRWLAVGGRQRVLLYELPALRLARRIEAIERGSPLTFLPDGSRLLGGGVDGSLTLWDPRRPERIATFPGHREACSVLALAPDGCRLATGSTDDTLELWDARPVRSFSPRASRPPR